MGRILGLDYGRRKIGVAISDSLGLTAQPLTGWRVSGWEEVVRRVCVLVEEEAVEEVVVGYPLTLKGERGRMAEEVERFAALLRSRIPVPVTLWDERLTSVQAERILHEMHEKPSRNKGRVDLIASVLLLQNYLDHQKGSLAKNRGTES